MLITSRKDGHYYILITKPSTKRARNNLRSSIFDLLKGFFKPMRHHECYIITHHQIQSFKEGYFDNIAQ